MLDLLSSFNLLLGRPWIHQAIIVPLTLYEKFKFLYEDTIITMHSDSSKGIVTSVPILEVQHAREDSPLHEVGLIRFKPLH